MSSVVYNTNNQNAMLMLMTLNSFENIPFPATTSLALMRNRKILINALGSYSTDRLNEINTHALKNDSGELIKDEQGNVTVNNPDSVERILNLDNKPVSLNLYTIDEKDLVGFVMSMQTLSILEVLFT